MALVSYTAPTLYPITMAEARAHLRLDSHDENDLVSSLIGAATEYLQNQMGRSFVTQTWKLYLDSFPSGDGEAIRPPRPPLLAVSSISYVDTNGDTQTWSSAEYSVDTYTEPGRITCAYGYSWPSTRDIENAVCVTYTAGFGTSASTAAQSQAAVPLSIKAAVKLLISHWYENREPVNIGNITTPLPMTVESLIWQNKVPELI